MEAAKMLRPSALEAFGLSRKLARCEAFRKTTILQNKASPIRPKGAVVAFGRNFRTAVSLLLVSCFLCGASVEAVEKQAVAEYCVVIGAFGDDSEIVLREFDAFANEIGFSIDKSFPGRGFYEDVSGDTKIILSTGFGPFGAVASVYRFDINKHRRLIDGLKSIVNDRISPSFDTQECASLEDFETPLITR